MADDIKDRRARRTQRALKDALLRSIEKKSISKITVAQLCEQADIGRGTFYLHYQDIYELMEQIEDEILGEIEQRVSGPFLFEEAVVSCCKFGIEHPGLKAILRSPECSRSFADRFIDHFESRLIAPESTLADHYRVRFMLTGSFEIMRLWAREGTNTPPEKLAETVIDILGQRLVGRPEED